MISALQWSSRCQLQGLETYGTGLEKLCAPPGEPNVDMEDYRLALNRIIDGRGTKLVDYNS